MSEEKNPERVPSRTPASGEEICRKCGGTGEVDGQECPECGGTGKVIAPIGGA